MTYTVFITLWFTIYFTTNNFFKCQVAGILLSEFSWEMPFLAQLHYSPRFRANWTLPWQLFFLYKYNKKTYVYVLNNTMALNSN